MTYRLGIDVGTTFTAAAVWRDDRVEIVALETHKVTVPTVVFADGDTVLFGSAAERRGATQPNGMAREFKRRIGDPVPIVLSGTPYSADRLIALFARHVRDTVAEQFGEPPELTAVTHPANWTTYQLNLLSQALDKAGLGPVGLISEPEAATVDFAAASRLEQGDLVLVYDLGGGTFDVAVLRREGAGIVQIGDADGVERLGGIDFDEAVFQHVLDKIPAETMAEARRDETGRAALRQLHRAAVEAKEALSSEVAVDVPVMLPGYSTSVRLTRAEFEEMIRPALGQTIDLVRQVSERSQITRDDLSAILLVGGSSRIPLVAELVGQQLGATVRVDAHPKLVVARGAARWAGMQPSPTATRRQRAVKPVKPEGGKSRRPLVVAAGVGVAALAAGLVFVQLRDSGGEASEATTPSSAPGTAPATAPGGGTAPDPPTTAPDPATTAPEPATTTASPTEDVFPTAGAAIPDETIVFTRLRSDGVRSLWALDLTAPADSNQRLRELPVGGAASWNNLPAVSPDRRYVAFTTQRAGRNLLAVAAWDGGERLITVDDEPIALTEDARATWSPDGTRLAYVANRSGRDDLYIFDSRTGAETQLTDDDLSEADPAWSPDGSTILFTLESGETGRDIYSIPVEGGEASALTSDPGDDADPAWSPDGTRIAFSRRAPGADATDRLFVMNADGSQARPLVTEEPPPGTGDADPTWSPDGTRIAFESTRDAGLWMVPADGGAPESIADDQTDWIFVHPAWSSGP